MRLSINLVDETRIIVMGLNAMDKKFKGVAIKWVNLYDSWLAYTLGIISPNRSSKKVINTICIKKPNTTLLPKSTIEFMA